MKKLIAGLTLLTLLGCGEAPEAQVLRVCLGEGDLPRADLTGGGFDVEVAGLLAEELNRQLNIIWLQRPQMTEIESSDISFIPLLKGRCDLMLSVPGAPALNGFQDHLLLSRPYYGVAFELIPEDAELLEGSTVAVRANTVAHLVIDALGFEWTMQPASRTVVDAVAAGEADVGLIWGPEMTLVDAQRNAGFEAPELLRWNQHAVVRRSDQTLIREIDLVIAENQAKILRILARHGMPPHLPWESIHESEALRNL